MGYDLHITRRKEWHNSEEGCNISLEEWLNYIKLDSELELTNGYKIKLPGYDESSVDAPGFCNWNAHPKMKEGAEPWFDYRDGNISTKYPDDFTITKMLEIADKLEAKVQGDDGEFYEKKYPGILSRLIKALKSILFRS